MKRINNEQINTPEYWDDHQTALDFGLRQQKYLELAGTGERIVELGCGQSPFVDEARKLFKEAWGIDYSPLSLSLNRSKFPEVNYCLGEVIDTPFKDKYFDVAVAGEVIEHLEEPQKLIQEMKRIAKKKIIISTPHLEFNDLEHLWEFDVDDFINWGFQVEMIRSSRFIGRSYIFAVCEL